MLSLPTHAPWPRLKEQLFLICQSCDTGARQPWLVRYGLVCIGSRKFCSACLLSKGDIWSKIAQFRGRKTSFYLSTSLPMHLWKTRRASIFPSLSQNESPFPSSTINTSWWAWWPRLSTHCLKKQNPGLWKLLWPSWGTEVWGSVAKSLTGARRLKLPVLPKCWPFSQRNGGISSVSTTCRLLLSPEFQLLLLCNRCLPQQAGCLVWHQRTWVHIWANYLTLLCLSFLFCKMVVMIVPTSWGCCDNYMN